MLRRERTRDASWAAIWQYGSPLDPAGVYSFDFGMGQRFNGEQEEGLTQDFDPRFRSPYHDPSDCYLRYRIDPTAAPKTIDLDDYSEKRQLTALGIYEITGDQFQIRLTRYLRAVEAAPAPQEFRNQSQFGEYSLLSWIDTDFQKTKKRCRAGGRLPRKLKKASLSLKKKKFFRGKTFLVRRSIRQQRGTIPNAWMLVALYPGYGERAEEYFVFWIRVQRQRRIQTRRERNAQEEGALWHLQVRRRPHRR